MNPFRLSVPAATLWTLLSLCGCASGFANNSSDARVPAGYYRVQRGDNVYRIGLRFGHSVALLQRWNGLANADAIEVGQLIRVRNPAAQAVRRPATPVQHQRPSTSAPRATTPAATTPNVSLQWPLRGPVLSTYNGTTQKGIDIGGARGAPVRAAAAGTVLYAGEELRGYGKLILLKHSHSTMTAYAHNDTLAVHTGQSVRAGQVIATLGDTGTQGVKLHFEVRINGQAVNPTSHLP